VVIFIARGKFLVSSNFTSGGESDEHIAAMYQLSGGYIYTSDINKISIPILHAILFNYDASIFYRIKHFECSIEAESSNGIDRIEIWVNGEMKVYQNFSNANPAKLIWMWEINVSRRIYEVTFRVYDFDNKELKEADFQAFIVAM